jgi:hypothetical protein
MRYPLPSECVEYGQACDVAEDSKEICAGMYTAAEPVQDDARPGQRRRAQHRRLHDSIPGKYRS